MHFESFRLKCLFFIGLKRRQFPATESPLKKMKNECAKLRALRASRAYVLYMFAALHAFVPLLLTYLPFFTCLHFFTRSTCLHLFYTIWNKPEPTATCQNKQERDRINQK